MGSNSEDMARTFIIKLLVNAAALWVADYMLTGFSVSGGLRGYVIAGTILALLNIFVRPLLKLLSFPLILLTFGLFTVVINAMMLWLTASLVGSITIEITGAVALLWATFIVSLMNMLFRGHHR